MATQVLATEVTGNTNAVTSEKSKNLNLKARAYLLTLNEISKYETLINEIKKLKSVDYFISSQETAPTTGHEHIHIYVHYTTPYKLNKKILATGVHVDVCRGSPKQNIAYVKKEGNIIEEFGNEPKQGSITTIGELKEIKKIDDVPVNMLNTWMKVQPTKIKKSEWMKKVEVHYICGPSGIGKSTLAQELADDEFDEVKFVNGFWSPCSGTGCCIYDDFRSSHMTASEFINFIDYRSHNLNVKGGTVRNNYTKIIITSIQTIDELYSNMPSEAKQQWIRRMIVHNLYPESSIELAD